MAQAFQDAPLTADQTKAAAFVDAPLEAPPSAAEARRRGSSFDDAAPPSGMAQWFEEKLRPMLEQVAHPKTIGDIAALLIPDQGITASVRAGARASASVGRSTAAAVASPAARTAAAEVVKHGATATGAYVGGAPGAIVGSTIGESLATRIRPAAVKAAEVAAEEAVSMPGYPRGGTTAPRVTATPTAVPVAAVDEFTAARTARSSAGGAKLPDQKALNEAALAARRTAYAEAQQSGAAVAEILPPVGDVVSASGKMKLTAPEMTEFSRLVKRGLPLEVALTAVRNARALASKLGGATDAQVAAAVKHRGATGAW